MPCTGVMHPPSFWILWTAFASKTQIQKAGWRLRTSAKSITKQTVETYMQKTGR